MNFHVGQKIVCIRQIVDPPTFGEIYPQVGRIYTIREIIDHGDHIGLRLEEIVNKRHHYWQGFLECDFWSDAFRPLIERKTDISIFKKMLLVAPKEMEPIE